MGVIGGLPPEQVLARASLPVQYEIGTATLPDGRGVVVLEVRTPAGEATYFLPPEFAATLAEHLQTRAAEARTGGLVVPKAVIPKDLNGDGRHR